MCLETNRIFIREFAPCDAGDLYEILGDEATMEQCEPAYSFAQTEKFLADFCIGKKGALAAVQKESGKCIGYILFKPLEEDVYEIGWFFNRKYWRQGYAFEACGKVIDDAFRERNAHKIMAETIDNKKSVPLMEKLGMQQEGLQRSHTKDMNGNWADFYLYGMLREDWEKRQKL